MPWVQVLLKPCCLSAALAPFQKAAKRQVKTFHSWSWPSTHGSSLKRLRDAYGPLQSLPPTRSPLGITSRTLWLTLHNSRRVQPLLPLQIWVVQPPWEWGGRGGGNHPPSPASAKALRLVYKSGAEGALSVAVRSTGGRGWEVSVPKGLRSLFIPPCPMQAPHGLRLLRLAAMNTCRDSMGSVAAMGMEWARQGFLNVISSFSAKG